MMTNQTRDIIIRARGLSDAANVLAIRLVEVVIHQGGGANVEFGKLCACLALFIDY